MVTTVNWDNISTDASADYGIDVGGFSTSSSGGFSTSSSSDATITQSISLPTPTYIFDERDTTVSGNIRVAQSNYIRSSGESSSINFTVGYTGELVSESDVQYIDMSGNIIIYGKIKTLKEKNKDVNSEKRIYDVTIYDYAYNLKEGNVNENFPEQYVENRIETIVEDNNLNFINLLTTSTTITLEKRTYQDKTPLDIINSLCDAIGASWRVSQNNFYLFRVGDFNSTQEINGLDDWSIKDGWTDDTTQKVDKVIIKGDTITQSATETFSGSQTSVTLLRTPVDIQIDGLTQTTSSIDGDYTVEENVVTFDSAQTDPEVKYSYESQLRVEVGDSGIQKVLSKTYITSLSEARKLGRNYLSVYKDGISSSDWENSDLTLNISNFQCGEIIPIYNRYATNRDGNYIISKVKRQYPKKITISVGEDTTSIYNWQKESKERIEELETTKDNSDYISKDVYKQIGVSVDFDVSLTKLYTVEDSGNILWASDTELTSLGDMIYDDGDEPSTYPLAYDESDIPSLPEYHSYL